MTLLGIISVLIGGILVSLAAGGLVTLAHVRGLAAKALAFMVTAASLMVVSTQVLSELGLISRAGFLVSHALITLVILTWWGFKSPRGRLTRLAAWPAVSWSQVKARLLAHPTLTVLGLAVAASFLLGAYLIIVVPPNSTDGLYYHLFRVAYWFRHGTLHHFQTPLLQRTTFPVNAEIGLLWLTTLSGSDRLGGWVQWILTIFSMVGIYGVARQFNFARGASLFAALVWSTLTIVVIQATAVKNDIVTAFFVLAAFYFLQAGLQGAKINLVFWGLALGLALGTKSTAWLVLPGFGLIAVGLTLYKHQILSKLVLAGGCALVGFMGVGAYNYALNWLEYRSFFGPAEISETHLVQNPSWATFAANLARLGYDWADLSGLPEPVIEAIRPRRAWLGESMFAVLGINPNPPGAEFSREFDFYRGVLPPYEKNAWFGPLGFLLVLPTLLFYLFISPFTEKNIWKWLTALTAVVFILVFAWFVRWQTQLGRMILVSVTLAAPLMAGFYVWTDRVKLLRWAVAALAILVLGWSATHNHHKPLFGPGNIGELDYYSLRLIQRPTLAPVARYVDAHIPADSKLGLAGDEVFKPDRTDYLFWGPNLTREVIHIGPLPVRIDRDLFLRFSLDNLIFAADTWPVINSTAPLWPLGLDRDARWFWVKGSEVELFSAASPRYVEIYGDDYRAYTAIVAALKNEAPPVRVLTTDPRMPYYAPGMPFVFSLPQKLSDLQGFTHLVQSPDRVSGVMPGVTLSSAEVQLFLAQEKFVKKVLAVKGYTLYRILVKS